MPNKICGDCSDALAPTIRLIDYLQAVNQKWKDATTILDQLDVKESVKTVYISIENGGNELNVYTNKIKHDTDDAVEVIKNYRKKKNQYNSSKRRTERLRNLRNCDISTDLRCPECDKSFFCAYKFNVHMKYNSERACVYCRKIIRVDEVKDHYSQHGLVPMQCDICFETFKSEDAFSKHKITYHSKGPYFCYICKLSYRDPHHLTAHMTSKHQPRICLGCDRKFSNVYCFRTHSRRCRNAKEKGGIFICDFCSKVYSSKYALKVHIEYIHMNKAHAHQCEDCGKVFVSAVHLVEHSNKHNRVADRYSCNICGLNMSTRRGYQRHHKKHVKNPNYVPKKKTYTPKANYRHNCEFCEEKFRLKSELHAHILNHHDVIIEELYD